MYFSGMNNGFVRSWPSSPVASWDTAVHGWNKAYHTDECSCEKKITIIIFKSWMVGIMTSKYLWLWGPVNYAFSRLVRNNHIRYSILQHHLLGADELTHWPLWDVAVILKVQFLKLLYRTVFLALTVMAWCHQASNHYVIQCRPRSLSPYSAIRLQRVNQSIDILV